MPLRSCSPCLARWRQRPSERVRAARLQLLKDGRWAGGGIPYGYQSAANPDGPGWVLVKDASRQPWLAEVVRRALDGATVNAITTWLTTEGAPLPEGSLARRKSGATGWNRQTVDGILRNPILAGMTPHNPGRPKSATRADPFAVFRDEAGEPVVNEALAVISTEEFTTLQRLLDARSAPQARQRSEREPTSPFLSRVVRCDDCNVFLCRGHEPEAAGPVLPGLPSDDESIGLRSIPRGPPSGRAGD